MPLAAYFGMALFGLLVFVYLCSFIGYGPFVRRSYFHTESEFLRHAKGTKMARIRVKVAVTRSKKTDYNPACVTGTVWSEAWVAGRRMILEDKTLAEDTSNAELKKAAAALRRKLAVDANDRAQRWKTAGVDDKLILVKA